VTEATERSVWLLRHLARFPSNTSALLGCGTVKTLVGLIRRIPPPWDLSRPVPASGPCEHPRPVEANTVEYAAGALALLALGDYSCRTVIAEQGAIPALVAMLSEGPRCPATENAVALIHCLASSTPALRDELRGADAIPAIVELLQEAPQHLNVSLTSNILWTLICLTEQDAENQVRRLHLGWFEGKRSGVQVWGLIGERDPSLAGLQPPDALPLHLGGGVVGTQRCFC